MCNRLDIYKKKKPCCDITVGFSCCVGILLLGDCCNADTAALFLDYTLGT